MPRPDGGSWAIIAWLAVVRTAFACTQWNQTLRTLSVVQSTAINNTMLVQIAVLAWVFLREWPTLKEMIGMALVGLPVGSMLRTQLFQDRIAVGPQVGADLNVSRTGPQRRPQLR